MSTMSTQLNYGASIIVNDIYRRFLKPQASQPQLVRAGRLVTLLLMILGCGLALLLRDALSSFELMLQIGAGTGLLLILRWFWWRISAVSELTALIVSFLVAIGFFALNRAGYNIPFWAQLVGGVALTTIAWLIATFASKPTSLETLQKFYHAVQPPGPGWNHIINQLPTADATRAPAADLPASIACMVASTIAIWSLIFSTGYFLYGRAGWGVLFAVIAAVGILVLLRNWPRLTFK
jgi:solute:Na+ symporter, SSS family